jgi:ribosome maturation factor RimP
MITAEQIKGILNNIIDPDKYFIVEINIRLGNKIYVALDGYKSITLDECVRFSREIESNFDREKEDFELEVSSPGLTEPFKVKEQYRKCLNTDVEVLLKSGKKLKGKLISTVENGIDLEIIEEARDEKTKKKKLIVSEQFFDFEAIKHTKRYIKF